MRYNIHMSIKLIFGLNLDLRVEVTHEMVEDAIAPHFLESKGSSGREEEAVIGLDREGDKVPTRVVVILSDCFESCPWFVNDTRARTFKQNILEAWP